MRYIAFLLSTSFGKNFPNSNEVYYLSALHMRKFFDSHTKLIGNKDLSRHFREIILETEMQMRVRSSEGVTK